MKDIDQNQHFVVELSNTDRKIKANSQDYIKPLEEIEIVNKNVNLRQQSNKENLDNMVYHERRNSKESTKKEKKASKSNKNNILFENNPEKVILVK